MKININDKIALVAKTKSGKSYLGKIIQRVFPRKIIIDTAYEYDETHGIMVYGFSAFTEAIKQISELDQYSIVFRFHHEERDTEKIFEEICRIVFYLQDTMLVIEEIHLHATTHSINPWLLKIATMGSHQNVSYILTTQRPSLIHKTLLTQCDHIFIGPLIDQSDLLYVKGFLGEHSSKIPSFKPRNFVYWNHEGISLVNTENLK